MSKKSEISRSEIKKYQDTMMADMGLLSLDELSPKEKAKWKKALKPSKSVLKKLKNMGYSLYSDKNKRSLGSLSGFLYDNKLKDELFLLQRILKKANIPELDAPSEDLDIEGVDSAVEHLNKNKGLFIHIDSPVGSKKWRINDKKQKMPFHYGEVISIINPADGQPWDVVIVPSANNIAEKLDDTVYVPSGHNLSPVGVIPINPDEKLWRKKSRTKSTPPIGNDKIILSPGGRISSNDKNEVADFFKQIWNFSDIIWL